MFVDDGERCVNVEDFRCLVRSSECEARLEEFKHELSGSDVKI